MRGLTATPFRAAIALAVLTAVVNGFWPSAAQGAYRHGVNVVTPLLFMAFARGGALVAFCLLTRRPLFATRSALRQGVIGGFFQAVANGGMIAALVFVPGPIMIIIVFTHSMMLLFFMAWRGEMKLTAATVVATAVALAGLTLVLDLWHVHGDHSVIGMALAFIAAIATVIRLYVFGQQMRGSHPIVVGAETFVFAPLFLSVALFFRSPMLPADSIGWVWLALLCLSTTAGIFCMFYGIGMMGAFRWSLYAKLEPIFTGLFAFLLLGETLKTYQYAGMGIVLASLAAYQIMDSRAKLRLAAVGDRVPT